MVRALFGGNRDDCSRAHHTTSKSKQCGTTHYLLSDDALNSPMLDVTHRTTERYSIRDRGTLLENSPSPRNLGVSGPNPRIDVPRAALIWRFLRQALEHSGAQHKVLPRHRQRTPTSAARLAQPPVCLVEVGRLRRMADRNPFKTAFVDFDAVAGQ